MLAIFSWQLNTSQKFSASINLAGRQRMLNQRHTSEVLRFAMGDQVDIDATRDLMTTSLNRLYEGGEHSFGKIATSSDPRLIDALNAEKIAFQEAFHTANLYIAAAKANKEGNELGELRKQLVDLTAKGHKAAHHVVTTLAQVSRENSAKGSTFAYLFGGGITLVCGFWALIVGVSTTRTVREKAVEFSELSKVKLAGVSESLKQNSCNTAERAELASCAAAEVSSNAQSLSNAVGQFEESIKEIAGNASGAVSVAGNAVNATERTNATISRLGESSSEIGNVIKVINSIAEQTNLLALNATIEAARAGDAGKGFAVVANEVKELAKETSKATEDIIGRIEAIQTDTIEAVEAIEQVSQIISEINESQNAIASAVEEQSAMTSEISRSITEVATGSSEIAENINRVAEAAKSTTESSDATRSTADLMDSIAHELLQFAGAASDQNSISSMTDEAAEAGKFQLSQSS